MHFSKFVVFLAAAATTAFAADTIPSGQGTIQLQNGTHVYGCIDEYALYVTDLTQCLTFTANGTDGVIGRPSSFGNQYLGIPQDAYPQPLLLFNTESAGIQWVSFQTELEYENPNANILP